MKKLVCALAGALMLVGAPAGAQPAAELLEDVEAAVVDDLVVVARVPGPPWWRVSDGDTTVYVLGIPDALPKGQPWDQSTLKRRLAGAHTFITPPVLRARGNPLALPVLIAKYHDIARSREGLEAGLPASLIERFHAAVARAGKKPKDYKDLRPFFAGLKLTGDYRKRVGLNYAEPMKTIAALGKKARLKATPAMTEDTTVDAFFATLKALPPAVGRDCLEGSIDEVEAGDRALRTAGLAWAGGDVPRALAMPRSLERCWGSLPGVGRLKREALARQAAAIEQALKKPGHAVAVLNIRSLVAREGILVRLRVKGYKVLSPGEPDGA